MTTVVLVLVSFCVLSFLGYRYVAGHYSRNYERAKRLKEREKRAQEIDTKLSELAAFTKSNLGGRYPKVGDSPWGR